MPGCKAPLPSPRMAGLRAGRRNPESGVATNKSRASRDCHADEWVSRQRRTRLYAAMTKDLPVNQIGRGNVADGGSSVAYRYFLNQSTLRSTARWR